MKNIPFKSKSVTKKYKKTDSFESVLVAGTVPIAIGRTDDPPAGGVMSPIRRLADRLVDASPHSIEQAK